MSNKLFTNPLDACIIVKNAIFDYVMPTLSGEGWKVLCVALRQSLGQPAEGDGPWISITQFMQNAGIPERKPAERALQECVYAGYLVAHAENTGSAQPHYTLNRKALLPSSTAAPTPQAAKATAATQAPQPPEQHEAVEALLTFGHDMDADPDPAYMQEITAKNTPEAVMSWIELGRGLTHMDTQTRFATVVERLAASVPPMPLSMLVPEDAYPDENSHATPSPPVAEAAKKAEAARKAGAAKETQAAGEAEALWEATLEALRSQMRNSLFKWFKPTHALELTEGTLVVATPNKRTKDWLETGQLAETVQETFTSVAGASLTLKFVVES